MTPTQRMTKIISAADTGEQKRKKLYGNYAQNTTFINSNTTRKMH